MAQTRHAIIIERLDPPDIDQVSAGPDFKRWLSNVVDILNSGLEDVQNSINFFITSSGVDVGGAGAGPINVPVIGLTPNGYVTATLVSSTNPVTIQTITPLTDSFDITFSADPGASAIIIYQAYTSKP